ncbi:hypothetical protein BEP19_07515 [Ammoniphilus oxalaticus]|uniref:Flagellar hook-length control protein-like C-terminal domain-containing protein n=1 Tax=Ammoniphilus oxalaticus TaxID=66863 RepID=A0A419SJP9_9BACL|nr:flagellar hook-length control protein FliK [Ammoniphilus oxalaticus]RKD24243.1 hypothetical protein BEP19_07515 [Ammoniphilus oxalaticus]
MLISESLQTPVQNTSLQVGKAGAPDSTATNAFSVLFGEFQSLTELRELDSPKTIEQEQLEEMKDEIVALLAVWLSNFDHIADEQIKESIRSARETPLSKEGIQSLLQALGQQVDTPDDLIQQFKGIADRIEGSSNQNAILESISSSVFEYLGMNQSASGEENSNNPENLIDQIMRSINKETSIESQRWMPFSAQVGVQGRTFNEVPLNITASDELTIQVEHQEASIEEIVQQSPEEMVIIGEEFLDVNVNTQRSNMGTTFPAFNLSFNHSIQSQEQNVDSAKIHQERLVPEMTEFLVSKLQISNLLNGTEARVSLYPEHLGHLDVRVVLQEGQMVAQFIAETTLGKDLLEAQLAGLRQSLQQNGIQVTKIDVQTAAETGLQNQQQQSQTRSGTYQQQHQAKQRQSSVSRVGQLNQGEVSGVYDQTLTNSGNRAQHSDTSIDLTA